MNNTKLFYVSGGLILGLALLFGMFLNTKTNSFLSSRKDDGLQVVKTASGRSIVTGAAPKSSWKKIGNSQTAGGRLNSQPHDSGYKPSSNYANDYIRAQEINHPLIASAKFIKKKDKLKLKKKPNSKLSKGKSRFGKDGLSPLSESPESIASLTTANAGNAAAAAAKAKKKAQEEEEDNLNSVDFWIDPIFVQEDPAAVAKLVDSYKIKKVSSGVFFSVVTQMNEDSRVNIRELGLSALTVSPSTQSFSQLTWIKHNDTEPDLRTEAGRQVASYSDVSKLGYVISALKTSDASSAVAVEALRTLTASTQKYGERIQSGGGSGTPAVDVSSLEPRYSRALEVIEQNNYSNSSNATVKTEATKTVAAINKFMTI